MKVLIVDDDYLVRKGIVSLMPWREFGLEVVGEAENGKKALQFLDEHRVDLVLADIAMPTMNGLELLREVRTHYPQIWVVMLTFHQDFEYIQEALRLGAIDYIAKVELEQENMREVLQRITARMAASVQDTPTAQTDDGEVRICLVHHEVEASRPDWLQSILTPHQYERRHEIEHGAWLLPPLAKEQVGRLEARLQDDSNLSQTWSLIKVEAWTEDRPEKCMKVVSDYLQIAFMYAYEPAKSIYVIDGRHDVHQPNSDVPKQLHVLKQEWETLDWLYQHERFEQCLSNLHTVRMTRQTLTTLFYALISTWERLLDKKLDLFPDARCRFWWHWEAWLRDIRLQLRSELAPTNSYSEDVMNGVMKAVDYIHSHLEMDLKLADVSAKVHISRSYFSECFKQIIGKPFNDYVREARIQLACSLLAHTPEPIYKIAEKCGYPDEKYFSRIFRQKMGKLPSEYRKASAVVNPRE